MNATILAALLLASYWLGLGLGYFAGRNRQKGDRLDDAAPLLMAAHVVVLDAGDNATGPNPDPNLAELAHCVDAYLGLERQDPAA